MKNALMILFAFCVCALAEELIAPASLKDWGGAMKDVTCDGNAVFDTHGKMMVLVSKAGIEVDPSAVYSLQGDFKLNPYATFGNIYFGLICYDADGHELGRRYIGESPFNNREHSSNQQLVRRYWLTFTGRIPSEKFQWPEGCRTAKIIIHFHENHLVDMKFKNVSISKQ